MVEEIKVGDYDCPDIVILEIEENRIAKPWDKYVIVKMLGKRIGYKVLENRLYQI